MSAVRPVRSPQDLPLITRRGGAWGSIWCAVVVVVLAVLILRAWVPLLNLDEAVLQRIRPWALANPWAVQASRWLYLIGALSVALWVALAAVLVLLARRRWWQALTLGLLAALAPLVTNIIKPLVDRPRPAWGVVLELPPDFSYPSGHATAGIAVYAAAGVALGSLFRSRSWGALVAFPLILLGVAIGLSRMVLGVHYPSDVVGGWFVALSVAGLLGSLFVLPPLRPDEHPARARR